MKTLKKDKVLWILTEINFMFSKKFVNNTLKYVNSLEIAHNT